MPFKTGYLQLWVLYKSEFTFIIHPFHPSTAYQGDLVTNKPNLLQILFQPVVLVDQLIHPVLQVEVKLSRDGDEMYRAQIKTIEHPVIILRHRESGLVVAEVIMVFMVS